MREILVTGGAGFVGHELVRQLLTADDNVRVVVLDNLSFGDIALVPRSERVTFVRCDLRSRSDVLDALAIPRFDCVFHLAAIHFIPYCNAHPDECLDSNVIGTRNLFEALRAQPDLRYVSNTSTMAVYPISDGLHAESDAPGPIDVYGKSKVLGEDLARLFHHDTKVPTVSWRLTNAVGRNETNEHLFPAILTQLVGGARRIALGNLDPLRNYIDTRDVSAYMRSLMSKPPPGYSVLNLGSEEELSVRQVVGVFEDVLGQRITVDQDPARVRPVERNRLQPSLARLLEVTRRAREFTVRDAVVDMLRASAPVTRHDAS
jgi:UDP-glucose 4-epimerase